MPKGQYVRKPRKSAAKKPDVINATKRQRRSRDAVAKERLAHFVQTTDLPPKLMLVWIMEGALRHINSILKEPRSGSRRGSV